MKTSHPYFAAILKGIATTLLLTSCFGADNDQAKKPMNDPESKTATPSSGKTEIITLGAGCFWCIEAVLEKIDGVTGVVSGYMGGHVKNPTYEEVCTKTTGHAEVVQVTFDPEVLPLGELLDHFWKLHDPTTLNRQGADEGPQYRSAIFYQSDEQKTIAEASKKKTDEAKLYKDPIVTEITKATTFFPAEDYHQDFYRNNPNYGYCRVVIAPKLSKLGLKDEKKN